MRCDYGLVGIGQAAAHYGVSVVTMRRWEREKRLTPTSRTLGGHRRYRLDGDDETTFEQTLCHDVMTLMAVFLRNYTVDVHIKNVVVYSVNYADVHIHHADQVSRY